MLEGVAAITARGPLSASDPTCLWVQEHGPVLAEKVGILLSLPEVDESGGCESDTEAEYALPARMARMLSHCPRS